MFCFLAESKTFMQFNIYINPLSLKIFGYDASEDFWMASSDTHPLSVLRSGTQQTMNSEVTFNMVLCEGYKCFLICQEMPVTSTVLTLKVSSPSWEHLQSQADPNCFILYAVSSCLLLRSFLCTLGGNIKESPVIWLRAEI